MDVIVQIPIIDLRGIKSEKAKLSSPSWPDPEMENKPFIRNFGSVRPRPKGGSTEFPDETSYCDARNAIQYVDLHKHFYPVEGGNIVINNNFKRFFSNGNFLNKIELGLSNSSGFNEVDIKALLRHYMYLPVKVGGNTTKLFKCGPALSSLYCQSTTRHSESKNDFKSLVKCGEICVVAIVNWVEKYVIPHEADPITFHDDNVGFELLGYTLYIEGYYIKSWIVRIKENLNSSQNELLRNLRINLMRIHAEKETIQGILNAVKRKIISMTDENLNAKMLSDYLKDASETLFKKTRYSINQRNMLNFALSSEESRFPGVFSLLNKSIKNQFTIQNVKKFIAKTIPKQKKTILFMCSRPNDKSPIDFGEAFKVIKDMYKRSLDRANYTIEIETGTRRTALAELLSTYKPDILHISMHGSHTQGLYFEGENRTSSTMSKEEWGDIIRVQSLLHRPQVIIFNACNSAAHANTSKKYCDYVVGVKSVIPEDACVAYTRGFYSILFNNENTDVKLCHDAGINEIKYAKPPFDWVEKKDIPKVIFIK